MLSVAKRILLLLVALSAVTLGMYGAGVGIGTGSIAMGAGGGVVILGGVVCLYFAAIDPSSDRE